MAEEYYAEDKLRDFASGELDRFNQGMNQRLREIADAVVSQVDLTKVEDPTVKDLLAQLVQCSHAISNYEPPTDLPSVEQ